MGHRTSKEYSGQLFRFWAIFSMQYLPQVCMFKIFLSRPDYRTSFHMLNPANDLFHSWSFPSTLYPAKTKMVSGEKNLFKRNYLPQHPIHCSVNFAYGCSF